MKEEKKEERRRKKEERRRKNEEGRTKKEERRRKKEEGRKITWCWKVERSFKEPSHCFKSTTNLIRKERRDKREESY